MDKYSSSEATIPKNSKESAALEKAGYAEVSSVVGSENKPIEFTPWPEVFAERYREKGYWIDCPLTQVLKENSVSQPYATAIVCGNRHVSYWELDALSDRLANSLLRRQLKKYDTALVQLPNVVEFYIVFFALLKIGVVPVNAIFNHQRLELNAYAAQIKPKLLIASSQHNLFQSGEFAEALKNQHEQLKHVLILGSNDYAENLSDCMALKQKKSIDFQPTEPDQVAFFQLSGGSTGTPKLIPRTHNDYFYSIRRSVDICRFTDKTRYLCALPAAHNFSLSSPGVLGVFYAGGTVVLAPDPEAINCFNLIENHQVNVVALVPPAVSLWLKALPNHVRKIRSLKLMQVGGANFAQAVAFDVLKHFGCQLQQVFGMAEGLVNYTRLNDPEGSIVASQGRPMCPDDEIKIVDENFEPVDCGETGMLLTRGPYTIRGYYQSAEHNKTAFTRTGFYCTGDLVQQMSDGNLQVVGRVKDQINRGGEKIATEEIENLLLQHEEIVHAALVAIPDEVMGEKSCAFVVTNNQNLRPIKIRQFLRAQGVAEYKLPDKFQLATHLPLTPIGKIDKKKLREFTQPQPTTQFA